MGPAPSLLTTIRGVPATVVRVMPAGAWAILVASACSLWWLYLAGSSAMVLRWDAAEYNALGEMLAHQGWREFLSTGPHREPLYPLLIALAIRIGDLLSLSYQRILVGFQCLLLLASQWLMWRLSAAMGVEKWLALAAIGYFGFSPAVVNSAFSMFSEVLAYPFVLLAAMLLVRAREVVKNGNERRAAVLALATASVFAAGAFTKGVLHYVSLLVILLFGIIGAAALRAGNRRTASAAAVFAVTMLVLGQGVIYSAKALNRKYNGSFEFTTRYVGLLYGNAAKRAMPMTTRQLLAHVAAIPGDGVCRMLFTEGECRFCEFGTADGFWLDELPRRLEAVPETQRRAATLRLFGDKVLEKPFQYAFVGATQVLRLPFWESTRIGNVEYPAWLERLYSSGPVKNGLRLLMGVLTLLALALAVARLASRSRGSPALNGDRRRNAASALILFIAASFMILYTPFSVLTRYALPIAPLFLLLVARMADGFLSRRAGTH